MKIFWGMNILWISFGVITKYQKVNPKNGPGLRMFENIRVPPPPLSHPGASMLGIREQYQRTSYFVFGVTTRLGVNYFENVINYLQLHWNLFN